MSLSLVSLIILLLLSYEVYSVFQKRKNSTTGQEIW